MLTKKTIDNHNYRATTQSLLLGLPYQWQTKLTSLRTLKQIQAFLVVNGYNSNPSATRELIFTCVISIPRAMYYAHRLFDHMSVPDTFTWNTMIRGSAQTPNPIKAISLYSQMHRRNPLLGPDKYTFSFVLKACTKLSWVNFGAGIHGRVVRFGFDSNKFVTNTLIYFHANCGDITIARQLFDGSAKKDVVAWSAITAGYARRGDLGLARRLFDKMPVRDMVSLNVMITAYAKNGDMVQARMLFDQLPRRDVVTWNAMISGYVLSGCQEEALRLYENMKCLGDQPDEVTLLCLLSACADLGDMEAGKKIHLSVAHMGRPTDLNILLGNALIDMYAKCGSIESAFEVFTSMPERDVSTWNSILGGLAFHGRAEELLQLFLEMQWKHIHPNEITFVAVLVACSHAGKIKEGQYYFDLMVEKYCIEPNMKHHGCMVDILGRAGRLDEAFDYIDKMRMEPNPIIWRTLLGACRVHGNVELASRANEQLMRVRRDQSGDYVLLSNIYASVEKWDGVEKVRNLMDHGKVRKASGASLVEADDKAMMDFLFESNPQRRIAGSLCPPPVTDNHSRRAEMPMADNMVSSRNAAAAMRERMVDPAS